MSARQKGKPAGKSVSEADDSFAVKLMQFLAVLTFVLDASCRRTGLARAGT